MNLDVAFTIQSMGTLLTAIGRAKRLLAHPLPDLETQQILISVVDEAHLLEHALIALIKQAKEEMNATRT